MALVLPCHTSHHDGLPGPVPALEGATSYWASAVASPPGHMSHLGARGTGGRWLLPTGRPAWPAYDLADQTSWRVQGGRPPTASMCQDAVVTARAREPPTMSISMISIDAAKMVCSQRANSA